MKIQTVEEILEGTQPLTNFFWSGLRGNLVEFHTGNPDINTILSWGHSQEQWNNTILFQMTKLSNILQGATMTDGANLIIIHENYRDIFSSLKNINYTGFGQDKNMIEGTAYFGTMANKIAIVISPSEMLKDRMLVCRFNLDGIRFQKQSQQYAFNNITETKSVLDKNVLNKVQEYCVLTILNK